MAKITKLNRQARAMQLESSGFNLNRNYFALSWAEQDTLTTYMKADGYRYDSPLGRSRLRSYYYSLQRAARRQA